MSKPQYKTFDDSSAPLTHLDELPPAIAAIAMEECTAEWFSAVPDGGRVLLQPIAVETDERATGREVAR